MTYNYAVGSCLPLCLSRRVQLSLVLKREFSDSSLRQIILFIFMVFLLTYKTRCVTINNSSFFPFFSSGLRKRNYGNDSESYLR